MILDKIYYKFLTGSSSVYDLNFVIDYTKINIKTLKKILNSFSYLIDKYGIYDTSVMCQFLYDVNVAIENTQFTDVQAERMVMWFDGYNESEIAEKYNITRQVVSKSIHAACSKIYTFLVDNT